MITQEMATAFATLSGIVGTGTIFLWKIFKLSRRFLEEQEIIKDSLKTIKSEVTPNGGKSIKDTINKLTETANRIEIRQKVIDQRTKATLHYNNQALFEIDREGCLSWFNHSFKELTEENGSLSGFDWFAIVDENYRGSFIKEVKSCLRMCRKIDIETLSTNGNAIRFVGYPYKTGSSEHEGFLIHLETHGEKS